MKRHIKTMRRLLSLPIVLVAGGLVTLAKTIGGYYIEFDISGFNDY